MPKNKIRVCCGMTCGIMGSGRIMKTIEEAVGVPHGQADEKFDLNFCSCTGNCHLAPNVVVNGNHIFEAKTETIIAEIDKAAKLPPEDNSDVVDATLEEIMANDLLGDV